MKKIRIAVLSAIVLMLLQFIPVLILKNPGMKNLEGRYVRIWYDSGGREGAVRVLEKLDPAVSKLREKLNSKSDKKTEVIVYSRQRDLHLRKLGFATLLFDLDWYIGDNRGDKALIVSPYSENEVHEESSILSASTHELVHTINYVKNRKLSYFLDNGVATYLSGQKAVPDLLRRSRIPENGFLDMRSEYKSGTSMGYDYSYAFVEFLTGRYGWDKVAALVQNEDYEAVFGKGRSEIYDEWITWLKHNYA